MEQLLILLNPIEQHLDPLLQFDLRLPAEFALAAGVPVIAGNLDLPPKQSLRDGINL